MRIHDYIQSPCHSAAYHAAVWWRQELKHQIGGVVKANSFIVHLTKAIVEEWQKFDSAKPGSFPEDLPPVTVCCGPQPGFLLTQALGMKPQTMTELRWPTASMNIWLHRVEVERDGQTIEVWKAEAACLTK